LLFVAALVSATLDQPAAGGAAGDIANQPVSGSLETVMDPAAFFQREIPATTAWPASAL
jgi:hypothetical protein